MKPPGVSHTTNQIIHIKSLYEIYFTWMAPKAAINAVSLYEGASPRVTGFEFGSVDQQVRNRGINPG